MKGKQKFAHYTFTLDVDGTKVFDNSDLHTEERQKSSLAKCTSAISADRSDTSLSLSLLAILDLQILFSLLFESSPALSFCSLQLLETKLR